MVKEVIRIKYFKRIQGKKKTGFYFSPPSYIVKIVYENSDGAIKLTGKKLSDNLTEAQEECHKIFVSQIEPYLKRKVSKQEKEMPQSLRYIWREFCKRRGIDCEPKGNILLDRPLEEQTKKDYKRQFKHISQVKSKSGKLLIDLNLDMVTPQLAERFYLQLYDICKAKWAKDCMDLLRLLFNYGKNKFGVLQGQNPFQGLRIPKVHNVQMLWTEDDVKKFNDTAIENNDYEIGLAVRLNWWLSQRKNDFFKIQMDSLKELNGHHYFELIPNKTKSKGVFSYAPIPPELYDEIKDRTGRLIHFNSARTFGTHFLTIKKKAGLHSKLSFETLRNSGSTQYYESGSTVTENMSVLGHLHAGTNMTKYRQNTPQQSINAMQKRLEKIGKKG